MPAPTALLNKPEGEDHSIPNNFSEGQSEWLFDLKAYAAY